MANKSLFANIFGKLIPVTDAVNDEGAPAYARTPKGMLAQFAATGCLHATFYATAETQLAELLALAIAVEPLFVAKTAVYARERGFMKDAPAVLLAALSLRDRALFARVFNRVVTDARMLRTFVQVMRSGAVGRKSLGTRPKRLVRAWLESRDGDAIVRASVGADPSLADVLRMVHPKPADASRRALYGYVLGRPYDAALLPESAKQLEAFKSGARDVVPDVPFQLLTSLDLGPREWTAIALRASWQTVRMNLSTFARHGVFDDEAVTASIADKLRSRDEIARARVFPYQLMSAWTATAASDGSRGTIPRAIRDALADAIEVATANVPAVDGKVFVCPDTSGSMESPVTGERRGATTSVRCVDVAALVAAALLRKNPDAEVLPFAEAVKPVQLNPRDTITTNAAVLATLGGGGTNCSAPLAELNRRNARGDLVVYVSDNESWADERHGRGTATMVEWTAFKRRNPSARLVCIDLQPNPTVQAPDRDDVLNVGGFSDAVFEVVAAFRRGGLNADHWVRTIDEVSV